MHTTHSTQTFSVIDCHDSMSSECSVHVYRTPNAGLKTLKIKLVEKDIFKQSEWFIQTVQFIQRGKH